MRFLYLLQVGLVFCWV